MNVWEKKGLIISACGQKEWMVSHIQNPCAIELENYVRIYFTTRPKSQNGQYRSVTAYMDLDKNDLSKICYISDNPILEYGNRGTFDEDGIMPGTIVQKKGAEYWLYYMGWRRAVSVPYSWAIGMAVSKDNGVTFEKFGSGPIMTVSYNDPYLLASPRSVFMKDGIWHMFYGSGTGWIMDKDRNESSYLIRHAVSEDGITWKRDNGYCVETVYEDESQGACSIVEINEVYHMFFSYRHSIDFRNRERGYLIGYAYSKDLKTWIRDDGSGGIAVSKQGWDSEMICYPHIIKIGEKIIMFYCGNGFGQAGLGYAELKQVDNQGGGIILYYILESCITLIGTIRNMFFAMKAVI